jgi:hypothetical protein
VTGVAGNMDVMAVTYLPVSRPLGPFAPIQAAVRERYYQPRRSSRLLGPPVVVLPLAAYAIQTQPAHWHVPDRHDLVQLATDGSVILLLLVVVIVGFRTTISYVVTRT